MSNLALKRRGIASMQSRSVSVGNDTFTAFSPVPHYDRLSRNLFLNRLYDDIPDSPGNRRDGCMDTNICRNCCFVPAYSISLVS